MPAWFALLFGAAVGLLLAGCGTGTEPAAEAGPAEAAAPVLGVTLDEDAQRKLGIAVAPLARAEYEERVDGTGLVVDVQSVIERMSALSTAEAAASQSKAALERAQGLYKADAAVSREVLEAAQSQAASDRARLDLAKTQAAVAFGYDAPWLDPKRRDPILQALTAGKAVVTRASFPGGLPKGVPDRLSLRRVGAHDGTETWASGDVWLGPADPNVPGPVLFAYVENAAALVSGERIVASVAAGGRLTGTLVPGSSVVIAGGAAWCYLREDENRFVRESVDLDRPSSGGYFQTDASLEPGQPVVVAGAGLLLARETGGAEEAD
jgi:hypothetical protein